jgi:hypothetical protein
MANTARRELIWEGRLHLGDEPGIYGDASYPGICAEHPITVVRSAPTESSEPIVQQFKLVLETSDLDTFAGYPGHAITVFQYVPDPAQPSHSLQQVLATARFTSADQNKKEVTIHVGTAPGPFRLSVQLRIDTTVDPGLYDDFVWRRLSLKVNNFKFFASFGFSA